MSVKISVKLEGGKELAKRLQQMPAKLARKTIRSSLKNAATPMLHAARSRCPIDSGDLVSTLRLAASNRRGIMKVRVAAGEMPKRSKSKKDKSGGTASTKPNTFYARFVEFGHQAGNGKAVPPVPFMRPAFDEHSNGAVSRITSDIRAGIEEAMQP